MFDPGAATDAALSRRVFVGIGAGAAALGSSASVLAATESFGKPHPPIVAEEDPAITVMRPMLRTGIPAYAAAPNNAARTTPGIVLVQHVWGVDATMRDDVRRLAKEGFVTAAPLLYGRMNPPDADNSDDFNLVQPYAQKLDQSVVQNDLVAAADWIRERVGSVRDGRPPKIGIVGFCGGGRIALRQAWSNPRPYDAAVIFYGAVAGQESGVPIPVMGNYGARDTGIPAADVRAFYARLSVPHDVKIYDEAGHAFFDDTRDSYVASAAAQAWTRSLAFLHKYLSA